MHAGAGAQPGLHCCTAAAAWPLAPTCTVSLVSRLAQLLHYGVSDAWCSAQHAADHKASAGVNHACCATNAEHTLRVRGQYTAHGDEAVLLLLDGLDLGGGRTAAGERQVERGGVEQI
jgi:hypothetical protein